MSDPEPPTLAPHSAAPVAVPVIEYASPSTSYRLTVFTEFPGEYWATVLVASSTIIGSFANSAIRGAGLLFMPPVVAGTLWYVVHRVRRRKRTRLVWKVQLVIASLLCIASTVGAVFEVEGFPVYLWWNYGRARDWADVVFSGVAWFIAAEAAAWVDRRVTRYGLPCPAPAEPE